MKTNEVLLIVSGQPKAELHAQAANFALHGVAVMFFAGQQALDDWHREQPESQSTQR